jgi:hypothetical protein
MLLLKGEVVVVLTLSLCVSLVYRLKRIVYVSCVRYAIVLFFGVCLV